MLMYYLCTAPYTGQLSFPAAAAAAVFGLLVVMQGPCVLFATPGMLQGGISLEVFKAWGPDPKNLVLLPSYQVSPLSVYNWLVCLFWLLHCITYSCWPPGRLTPKNLVLLPGDHNTWAVRQLWPLADALQYMCVRACCFRTA